MRPKIDKNEHLGLKVPVGCPSAPLEHQNGNSGYPKWTLRVSKAALGINSNPLFGYKQHPYPGWGGTTIWNQGVLQSGSGDITFWDRAMLQSGIGRFYNPGSGDFTIRDRAILQSWIG